MAQRDQSLYCRDCFSAAALRLQTCLLLLCHPLLNPHPLGDDLPPRRCQLDVQPVDTERFERLALDQGVVLRVSAIEVERPGERDGRVRDDARDARVVLRRRVQHERVADEDVADVAGELDEACTALGFLQVIPELRPPVSRRAARVSEMGKECGPQGAASCRRICSPSRRA